MNNCELQNKESKNSVLNEFEKDFVNYEDLKAFAAALEAEDQSKDPIENSEKNSPELKPVQHKVELIRSHHDWTPVHEVLPKKKDVSKSRRRSATPQDEIREGLSYTLFRWPVLICVLLWIFFLSFIYFLIRVYISIYEHYLTWIGRRKILRQTMRNSTTYSQWTAAAKKLDDYLGYTSWKKNPKFSSYDYKTVLRTTEKLRTARLSEDVESLAITLEACIKNNFAGIENSIMYSRCYYGTKNAIDVFTNEIVESLNFLSRTDLLSSQEKNLYFKNFSKNYGRTALCLSGGASFAYYHFGIVKALLDQDLLPNIITGTSGGGLVAALACTRTNEELSQLLIPELADKITACSESTKTVLKRWWETGARYDAVEWAKKAAWFTYGNLTFREAYKRTGKILNISTVPADPHSPVILCNYITSPNTVIWSALLASAAVPGILNPVALMMKTKNGNLIPYSFGNKWRDGSLRTDIPLRELNTFFNVNFSIVSQVNPHVSLFFFSPRGAVGRPVSRRKGKGWRGGFIGSALEQYIKLDINKWLKVSKDLELVPRFFGQDLSSIFLQRFEGTITIWPKTRISDFYYILSDPTRERLARMLREGERCCYPKIYFIKNRKLVEKAINSGLMLLKAEKNRLSEAELETHHSTTSDPRIDDFFSDLSETGYNSDSSYISRVQKFKNESYNYNSNSYSDSSDSEYDEA